MNGSIYSSMPPRPPFKGGLGVLPISPTQIYELPLTVFSSGGITSSSLLGAMGGPIGLAITGGMIGVTQLISHWKKAAQRRAIATQIVNEIEPYFKQNLDAFLANPTESNQKQAIYNFYVLWDEVLSQCGKDELGQAGRRCISDREEGSTALGWGNWFTAYLDPIRNHQGILEDPTGADILTGSLGLPQEIMGFPTSLVLGITLVGLGFLALKKS